MLKQSVIYFVLSLIVIFFAAYAKAFLLYAAILYAFINALFEPVFGTGLIADALSDMLTLVFTPFLLAGIPALIYWLIKRKKMPYFIELIWLFWIIFALSSYLVH